MLILGAHMSIAGGFAQAAQKTGEEFKANAMQIFTKSPRSRIVKPIDPEDAEQFKMYCKKYHIKSVIAHSSYLLNFGKRIKSIPWMLEDITTDFTRLHAIGGQGVVVHIGKFTDGDKQEAIQNVIENAKQVVHATEKLGLQYILENTAGQGTEIGHQLEELGEVWKGLKGFSPRIKSCLDTAHIWAAGYDIGTKEGAKKTLKQYDELVGLKTLACFHFNDSKQPQSSHLDRHENIGAGFIGLEGLKVIAKYAQENSVPLILETPDASRKGEKQESALQSQLLSPQEAGTSGHFEDLEKVRGFF